MYLVYLGVGLLVSRSEGDPAVPARRDLGADAGVPATEVAARAGHSVAVLPAVYAKCMDGGRATYNSRISAMID